MPDITDGCFLSLRKILPIIYVIDTSGKLHGKHIACENEALSASISYLKEKSEEGFEYAIEVGILSFSTGAKWMTNGFIPIEDLCFENLQAGGLVDLGASLDELNEKMSRKELFANKIGYLRPVVLFLSASVPTDNWEKALACASENKWYKYSIKIGIAVGDDFDVDIIEQICGGQESVIRVDNFNDLSKAVLALHRVVLQAFLYNVDGYLYDYIRKMQINNFIKEDFQRNDKSRFLTENEADWD